MKRGKFDVEMYGHTIHVYVFDTAEQLYKYYQKCIEKYGLLEDKEDSLIQGLVFLETDNPSNAHLLYCKDYLTHNTITHEISHLTFEIFSFNNISTLEDRESFALLNGYLNEKVFNFLQTKKCLVKKK